MSQRDVCVIFNPASGKGKAGRRLAKLRQLGREIHFLPTQRPGHGVALAEQAAQEGFQTVVAAGGDGTVHEVANGLLQANNPDVRFGILPIGSANDYHASLLMDAGPSGPSETRTVDVGLVRAANGRRKYFVCCLGLGFNGAVTVEARKIKGLQGVALYGWATLRALWYHYGCPSLDLAIDGQPPVRTPSLMLSVLVGKREGNFVMAPKARLDDGLLDYIHSGSLSRWEVLRFLPRLALAGPPEHHPKVRQGQCRSITLACEVPLVVHIDGEFFCVPEENIHELEIVIVKGALTVDMSFGMAAAKR